MKAFIVACVVAVVIAVCGVAVLNGIQKPVDVAFTTSGVRI
jgi:Flp pilus assembly pilin Flp